MGTFSPTFEFRRSISPTFYKQLLFVQKCFMQLLCAYSFGLKIFGNRKPAYKRWKQNVGEIGFRRCQFHQHFTSSFFVQKSFEQLFCTYGLGLYFFGQRKLAQKLFGHNGSKNQGVNFTNALLQSANVPAQGVGRKRCNSVSSTKLQPTLQVLTTRSYAQLLHSTLCTRKQGRIKALVGPRHFLIFSRQNLVKALIPSFCVLMAPFLSFLTFVGPLFPRRP